VNSRSPDRARNEGSTGPTRFDQHASTLDEPAQLLDEARCVCTRIGQTGGERVRELQRERGRETTGYEPLDLDASAYRPPSAGRVARRLISAVGTRARPDQATRPCTAVRAVFTYVATKTMNVDGFAPALHQGARSSCTAPGLLHRIRYRGTSLIRHRPPRRTLQ